MAKLLKINDNTKREFNSVGDIVGVFEDSHKFDQNELILFDVEEIPGTRDQITAQMQQYIPEQKIYFKNESAEFVEMKVEPKYSVSRIAGEWVNNIQESNKLAVEK